MALRAGYKGLKQSFIDLLSKLKISSSGVLDGSNIPISSTTKVGGIKIDTDYGLTVGSSNGKICGIDKSYSAYKLAPSNMVVAKGTLNNVLANRGTPEPTNDDIGKVLKVGTEGLAEWGYL